MKAVGLAGNGILLGSATAELLELAVLLHIPVITSPLGKGAIDERSPLGLGATGRNGTYAGLRKYQSRVGTFNRFLRERDPYGTVAFVRMGIDGGEVRPDIELRPRPDELGEVDETGDTLEDNARLKAVAVTAAAGLPAVADDPCGRRTTAGLLVCQVSMVSGFANTSLTQGGRSGRLAEPDMGAARAWGSGCAARRGGGWPGIARTSRPLHQGSR